MHSKNLIIWNSILHQNKHCHVSIKDRSLPILQQKIFPCWIAPQSWQNEFLIPISEAFLIYIPFEHFNPQCIFISKDPNPPGRTSRKIRNSGIYTKSFKWFESVKVWLVNKIMRLKLKRETCLKIYCGMYYDHILIIHVHIKIYTYSSQAKTHFGY